jgi:cobalt-zinc-cadmium resistance protein CzcA
MLDISVRGRDLGSTVSEAIRKVNAAVKLPPGYTIDWAGEYESQKRSQRRLLIVLPLTILLIYIILYTMFKSMKWALLILTNIAMAPIGGLLALLLSHTNFSVSSGVGFLALFGVSVQIGVIMVEYINQLRARGYTPEDAAVEGAVLRLRPIIMTMLVATLGLMPGGAFARYRLGFAAPLRHCYSRGTHCFFSYQRLSAADPLRLVGS